MMSLASLLVTGLLVRTTLAVSCLREPGPDHAISLKSPGDNGFKILVSGEPDKYVPGSVYTLSLVGARTHGHLQQFTRFMLGVEPSDPRVEASPQRVGSFQLFGDSLTTFNELCINTISEADDLPKTEIQVMWISPPKGSGCVVFRAMVLENKESWFADDGALSRELCELETVRNEKDEAAQSECCACDEAKYQLIFEGIWSNITHPRDFPFSLWLTHFSDVIGGSHERNFSFWGEGQYASDGLRQVAEWGSVRGMEAELRAKSKHLRTLIKAAGLWYPKVNTNTSSNFRVDRRRHLLSVVSMLESNSYPFKRNPLKISYKCLTKNSPNSPTIPQEKIYRITTMYPEDPRAPLYDPTGTPMKPLARLYLKRESIVPKSCDDQNIERLLAETIEVAENTEDTSRPECAVTEYSEWSACSVSCGKGLRMRQRSYLMPQKAEMLGCNRQLISKEMCVASLPECPGEFGEGEPVLEDNEGVCSTTPWSQLSECSVSCGVGVAMRTRRFLDRMGRKKCPHVSLLEKEKCMMPPCTGPVEPEELPDPMCPVTPWNDWSTCSASCGKGVKFRSRLLLVPAELQEKCSNRVEVIQQRPCVNQPECTFDMATAKQEIGPCRGYFQRWFYNAQKGMCVPFGYGGCRGNSNNFLTEKECQDTCAIFSPSAAAVSQTQTQVSGGDVNELSDPEPSTDPPVNCLVSDWSVWTDCSVTCGVGIKERFRMIKVRIVLTSLRADRFYEIHSNDNIS
nr:unnamed protein product [Timema douglasi]